MSSSSVAGCKFKATLGKPPLCSSLEHVILLVLRKHYLMLASLKWLFCPQAKCGGCKFELDTTCGVQLSDGRMPVCVPFSSREYSLFPSNRVRVIRAVVAPIEQIKATPQLFAFGVANLAGSIFSSLPGSASLSRGKTLVAPSPATYPPRFTLLSLPYCIAGDVCTRRRSHSCAERSVLTSLRAVRAHAQPTDLVGMTNTKWLCAACGSVRTVGTLLYLMCVGRVKCRGCKREREISSAFTT